MTEQAGERLQRDAVPVSCVDEGLSMFDAFADSVVAIGREGRVVYWNDAATRLFGFSAGDALGREASFMCPPERSDETAALVARAFEDGPQERFDTVRVRADGMPVAVSLSASVLPGADRASAACILVARALSGAEPDGNAFAAADPHYRAVATMLPDAVVVHRNGPIIWANPAAVRMFSAGSVDELLHRNLFDLMHPDDVGETQEAVRNLALFSTTPSLAIRRYRLDGELIQTEGRAASILWGGSPALIAVIRDISARVAQERRLAETEQRLAVLAQLSPDSMIVHKDGEIVYANPAAARLFAATRPDDLVGRDMAELIHPDDLARVVNNWTAWREGRGQSVMRARRLRLDGSVFDGVASFRDIRWEGAPAYLVVLRDESEARRHEAALRESEELHRRMAALIPDGLIVHIEGRIAFANPAAISMLRAQDLQSLIGRDVFDLVSPAFRDMVRERAATQGHETPVPPMVVTHFRLDGSDFPCEVSGRAIRWYGRDGRLVVMRDVSERLRIERELSDSETRYRNIVALTPDAVLIHIAERIVFANPAAVAMFAARDAEDLVGRHIDELIPEEGRDLARDRRRQLKSIGRLPAAEVDRLRLDGTRFPAEVTGSPYTWVGRPAHLAIVRDVTARRRAEDALRETERRYAMLTEVSPDAIMVHDGEVIVYANEAAGTMFAAGEADDLVGVPIMDTVHPDDWPRVFRDREALVDGAAYSPRIDTVRVRLDGSTFHGQSSGTAIDWDGTRAFLVAIRDVSAQRDAEIALEHHARELERANGDLEQFAYVASHDLRAPLRGVSNLLGWVDEDAGDVLPGPAREHLHLAQGRVRRLDRLLSDLLAYSRAGYIDATVEAVDVDDLVRRCFEMIDPPDGITLNLPAPLPVIETARAALDLVFRNLIGNAVKHNEGPHGCITVTASAGVGDWEFSVGDDGPGIPSEFRERVFEMFQTLRPRDSVEGSGMGLAIVRRTVEAAGGWIRVEPADGDRGAVFRFSWPGDWSDGD